MIIWAGVGERLRGAALAGPARRRLPAHFSAGEGVLTPEADRLVMRATAADAGSLAVVQDVLGRHLERFGQRRELVVTWQDDAS
jgi:hypothetical protein